MLPFQEIDRKLKENTTQQKVATLSEPYIGGKRPKLFAFDILALGGKSLCHLDFDTRIGYLEQLLSSEQDLKEACDRDLIGLSERRELVAQKTKSSDAEDDGTEQLVKAIDEAQTQAIKAGCEGIIVKSRDAKYETNGTRVNTWIKLKNVNLQSSGDPSGAIRDTLDLVPIGGFYGKGSRTGVFGSYLMAAYSVNMGRFYTVCKLGTGFSQEMLKELDSQAVPFEKAEHSDLSKSIVDQHARQIYQVASQIKPDVWFKPTQIWEVQADCFTSSKVHSLGQHCLSLDKSRGLSLRFPRFIRRRQDKEFKLPL